MPQPRKRRPVTRPRRRGTHAETHAQLLAATLDLLHTGGEPAVSTVSVTRAAGLVQSSFYLHFANVGECLVAAAETVAEHIRVAVASARRQMYESGSGFGEDLEAFFRAVFALTAAQRPTVELFLRHRTDPLALDGVMHRLAQDLRADLARDLAEQAARAGVPPLPAGWVEFVADNLIGANLSAIEAQLEGRGPNVAEAARVLAAFSSGACLAVIEAARVGKARGRPV